MSKGLNDVDLIAEARGGDDEAYAELYRRHRAAALRFARSLTDQPADAEDLVGFAFARVLAALRKGGGPTEAFRPYLLATIRNVFLESARRSSREQPVDDLTVELPFADPVTTMDDSRLVAAAFSELPERWQVVLWHTEVEGENPADLVPLLGISANAVSALAYRAREGLRERYLQAHVRTATDAQCRPTVERLGAYLRHRLSGVAAQRVQNHLDACDRCRLLAVELSDVNRRLGTVIGPIVLGGAAATYLAASGAVASGVAAGGAFAGGVAAGGAVASGAVASGVATGGVTAGGLAAHSLLGRIIRLPEAQVGAGVAASAGVVSLVLALSVPSASTPIEPDQAAPVPPPVATATGGGTGPSAAAPPGLVATLEPVGSLARDHPGVLLLTVTGVQTAETTLASTSAPTTAPAATPASTATSTSTSTSAPTPASIPTSPPVSTEEAEPVVATLALPDGVTLRAGDPGDGWVCASGDLVTCTRQDLVPGETTRAYVPVSVAATAADGVPAVLVDSPRLGALTVAADRGVVDGDLGVAMAMTGPADVVVAGNSLLSCQLLALACITARGGATSNVNVDNDDYSMTPFTELLSTLSAPLGTAVSSADIEIGGEVIWARLYWAGTGAAPDTPVAHVRPPGLGESYSTLPATDVHQVSMGSLPAPMYQASADVTDLVRSAPRSGTWVVAVARDAFAPGPGSFAGWALMAVVDSGGPVRTVAVLDGVVSVDGTEPQSSTLYGLGSGAATVGLVAWDGDRGRSGDTLLLDGVEIGPPGNLGISSANGTLAGWNTFGTDARVFEAMLSSSDPVLTVTGGDDAWCLGALAVVTEP